MLKNYIVLLLVSITLPLVAEKKSQNRTPRTPAQCRDSRYQCYCSRICEWRDKGEDDEPVWVENDPAGIHCYCKPWDRDNYNKRCLQENLG